MDPYRNCNASVWRSAVQKRGSGRTDLTFQETQIFLRNTFRCIDHVRFHTDRVSGVGARGGGHFLQHRVWLRPRNIFLSQGKYVVKLLERFGMVHYKFVSTLMELNFKKLSGNAVGPVLANPTECRQLMGALMFLVKSHSDICFAVNTLSQHMVDPHHIHSIGAKNLLRYLWGTINHGLRYIAGSLRIHGYTDADWVGSVVDRKITSICCFTLGFASISWMSRTQKSVALSTTEAEYIAVSMACCEVVLL